MKKMQKSGKNKERVRLYALGDEIFQKRIRAAAALEMVTQEEFITAILAEKVDSILAKSR